MFVEPRSASASITSDHFGGWLDSAISAAKSVIPSHTIVGKALAGNISGAAASTVKLVSGGAKPSVKTDSGGSVAGGGPGLFDPGGFVEQNQTALLLVAAGLGAFLIMRRKGGGRRRR